MLQRMTTDISDVSKSVGKKFEATYKGFGNILDKEYHRVASTSGKIVKGVLSLGKETPKKEKNRPSAQELSEHVKLFQELKSMKKKYSFVAQTGPAGRKMCDKDEDELIKEYLSEVTQELYLRSQVDNMTAPILELIEGLFQLDTKDWLRRQMVGVTKQLFEVFVGSRVEKFLMNKIKMLCTEETVASIVDSITDALWPNGIWMAPPEVDDQGKVDAPEKPAQAWERKPSFSPNYRPSIALQDGLRERSFSRINYGIPEAGRPAPGASPRARGASRLAPSGPPDRVSALRRSSSLNEAHLPNYTRIGRALSSIMPPEHIEIMNDEEAVTRDKVKAKLKDLMPPKAVSTLIGKRNFLQGVNDLFDFIQSETMMAQLGHMVIEIILVKEFPELEQAYARVKNGDLSLPFDPEDE